MESTQASQLDLGTGSTITQIVVPVALTESYDRGVVVAARLAERWGLPMRLVSVDVSQEAAINLDLGETVERSRRSLSAAHPKLTVHDNVIAGSGDGVGALADALDSSDLVVMATEAGAGGQLDSFAQALAHEWGGPIMMIGPNVSSDVDLSGAVGLGVDGSALAERALPVAAGLAARSGTDLRVVQVVPTAVTRQVEHLRSRGERVSESSYVADLAEKSDPNATWAVVHGDDPVDGLLSQLNEGLSILTLATHGSTGLPRPTFGSVCMGVVSRAAMPVVVVRPTTKTAELSPPT